MVILNDLEAVKDAFHKDALLGRPNKSQFTLINPNKGMPNKGIKAIKVIKVYSLEFLIFIISTDRPRRNDTRLIR